MRKYIALGLLLSSSISLLSAIAGEVQHQGSLKKMHHGEFQGVVDLSLLAEKPFLTAVGPLENLSGEFTAFKGRLFSTQAAHGQLKTYRTQPLSKQAFWFGLTPKTGLFSHRFNLIPTTCPPLNRELKAQQKMWELI